MSESSSSIFRVIQGIIRITNKAGTAFANVKADLNGEEALTVLTGSSLKDHFDLLNLVKPLYEDLVFDQITETVLTSSFIFDIINEGEIIKTFEATLDDELGWSISSVPPYYFLGTTTDDEFLVQENGDKLLLEV